MRRGLALDEGLGGGNAGVDLAGGIKRGDARGIELEGFALLRRPLRDGFFQLRVNAGRLFGAPLRDQDVAEAGENGHGLRRIVGDAERALHVERRARQLLGVGIAALIDQDAGKADNEFRCRRRIFALGL